MKTSPASGTLHALAVGALAGTLLGPVGLFAPVLAVGLGSTLALVGLRVGARPRAWVCGLACLLGAVAASGARVAPSPMIGDAEVEGLVVAERGGRVELAVDRATSPDAADLELDRAVLDLTCEVGDRVRIRASLVAAPGFRNASPHPELRRSSGLVFADEVTLLDRVMAHDPAAYLARVREQVRRRLEATLAPDAAGLVRALVLGDAGALDAGDAAATRRAGLSHVVAVSGMHVTLVVGALVAILAAFGRRSTWLASRVDPRRLAWGLGVGLAPLYAAFAGGSPSAWRAAATSSIVWSLAAAGRRADPLAVTALVVVSAVIVTHDAVRSQAFVLSVAATAAVLEPMREESPDDAVGRLTWWKSAVRASVRASIATAPLTLWCFATLSPLSALANLVVVPIVAALLLPLGTMHALLACVSTDLAALTAWPTERVVRAFLALADFFGDASAGAAVPPPDAAELIVVGAMALASLVLTRASHLVLAMGLGLCALAGAEGHLRARESAAGALRVTFLDVGQGDAALLDLPDGSLWLIDAGGASFGSSRDPGELAITPLLRARRRDRIDVAIISHPHPDHHGGFPALTRHVVIGELWDSGQAAEEQPDGPWARGHRGLLVPIHNPETLCGRPRHRGGARIEVLWPCPRFDPAWDANENSLVVRVTYGRRTFLFLGDAESHTERTLASSLRHVDVLKVGHHGSRTSSTPELVLATRPWLAVISAGPGNRHGHPHAEVVERWTASATHLARTDLDGSVTVWTDGDRLEASTWSGRELVAPRGLETRGEPLPIQEARPHAALTARTRSLIAPLRGANRTGRLFSAR